MQGLADQEVHDRFEGFALAGASLESLPMSFQLPVGARAPLHDGACVLDLAHTNLTGNSDTLAVSLLDRNTTTGQGESVLEASGLGTFDIGVKHNSLVWLLLLALIGLLVEWWLYQRGRMP